MPELPEVATVRRGLEKLLLGRTILSLEVKLTKMIKTSYDSFMHDLPGQTIQAMRRRGKYLIFDFGQLIIISHLRMEGKYLLFTDQVPDNKHFHLFFKLDDGSTLVYQDVRKFGTFDLLDRKQEEAYFTRKKLGPEPTKKTFKYVPFERALMHSGKSIKPLLLEQKLVAGLGIIFVDEVLWADKVHPETPANKLSKAAMKRVHDQTIAILQLGIAKGGSTIRTYRNALGEDGTMQNYLQVYGKTGQPCPRCASMIVKIKLGGRGTHLCPHCQKR